MIYIQKFFGHLKTVLVHKWWVFYYCCKAGIPWRGLIHDLSKFHPIEFLESVKYYSGTRSPIDACKDANGYSEAWMHHKGRNRHHYEYWMDNFDKGGQALKMPYICALEMICDYLGAGRAYYGKEFTIEKEIEWWENKRKKASMHEVQKKFIDNVFDGLTKEMSFDGFSLAFCYILTDLEYEAKNNKEQLNE